MKLYVVGLGPGAPEQMTARARAALEESSVVAGYRTYLALVRDWLPGKEFLETGMKKEAERCRAALEAALGGKTVSLVCSGDAGVYGMAGLLLELAEEYPPLEIEIVPGVTAACSGAAVLGAPLGHDFAVVSLSDLLTPWETIEKRLDLAAQADFALCLYNPSSHARPDYLRRACDILLRSKSPDTVCGWVRNIGREGEEKRVLSLAQLRGEQVDMFTTVFVGSSATRQTGGRMVTPRGYRGVGKAEP